MDSKIIKNYFIAFFGLSLLFLMMVFISQLYAIKIILMILLLILTTKKIQLSYNVRIAFFLIIFYGVYGIFFGVIHQTENPFLFVTIYCVWPVLYLLYTSNFLIKHNYFTLIVKTIFYAHAFIVLYDLIFAWGIFAGVKVPNIYTVGTPFSIYLNATRMNFVNLNSLTFSTPVLFILFIGRFDLGISRKFQVLILFFTFFLFIISGRRSVILIVLLLPLIPLVFSNRFSKQIKKNLIRGTLIVLFLFISTFFYLNKNNPEFISNYTQVFLKAFDTEKEPIKFAQQKMLMEKFEEKPLFGHGSGCMFYEPAPGRMMFANQFELSYHLKLAFTGIIGFLIIIGVYVWILLYGLFLARKKNDLLFLSFLGGYFFMLIADATNPVLCSFDLIWPIYLCLAKINYWELNNSNPVFE